MQNNNDKLKNFGERLKKETFKAPFQQIVPAPEKDLSETPKEESQLNVWIPKLLLKKIKLYAAENEISLKEITIEALQKYLSQNIAI